MCAVYVWAITHPFNLTFITVPGRWATSISLPKENETQSHLKHQRDTQPQNSWSQAPCFSPHQSDLLCPTAAGLSPVHKASIPILSLPCSLPEWPLPVRSYLFTIPCPWLMPPSALGDGTKGSDCDCFPSPPAFLLILPLKVLSEWIDTQVETECSCDPELLWFMNPVSGFFFLSVLGVDILILQSYRIWNWGKNVKNFKFISELSLLFSLVVWHKP